MDVSDSEHVVALCGSQRDGSFTRVALERTLSAAETRGATTDLVDLGALDLPVFDPDRTDAGNADALRRRVRDADAVLLGTPMYHGSYSSTLKTALDYCGFDEFEATTVGLLVVSGGGFPTPALEHLRSVARALDAWVLPTQVAIPDSHGTFEGSELTDSALVERVETLGTELVDYAGVESYPETVTTACTAPTAD
jgi:NAD(P)H-dependent FMN reductase